MNCASCWRACAACCAAFRHPPEPSRAQPAEPEAPRRRTWFGVFQADFDARTVTGPDGILDMAKSEFDVLEVFLKRANRLLDSRGDFGGDRLGRGSRKFARR